MSKPPRSTPHSDLDGVREDERRNTDVAADLGQSAGAIEEAQRQSIGRPRREDDKGESDGAQPPRR